VNRRQALTAAAGVVAAVAGCSAPGGSADVTVENETGQTITVAVEVTAVEGSETVVSEAVSVDPAAETVYEEITDGRETTISVQVRDGPAVERPFSDSEYDDQDIWFRIYTDRIGVIRGSA